MIDMNCIENPKYKIQFKKYYLKDEMKKFITCCITALVLIAASMQSAFAIGLALTRQDLAYGMPLPVASASYSSAFNRLVDRLLGTQVIFDTAVAKDKLFNYRLNFECDTITTQKDFIFANLSYNTNRLTVANTFGFGFVRTKYLRVWAGPHIALSYEFKNRNNFIFDSLLYNKIGSVVGLNVNTGNDMTFAFEMGVRSGFGFDLKKALSSTVLGSKVEPIASVKLIFRSWDAFVPSRM